MKKIILGMLLCSIMIVSLTGCGKLEKKYIDTTWTANEIREEKDTWLVSEGDYVLENDEWVQSINDPFRTESYDKRVRTITFNFKKENVLVVEIKLSYFNSGKEVGRHKVDPYTVEWTYNDGMIKIKDSGIKYITDDLVLELRDDKLVEISSGLTFEKVD